MYCPNCGAQVDDKALFCGECGVSLAEDTDDEQIFDDGCLEEDTAESVKRGFFHSTAGKIVMAVAAIGLAGTAAITGMAQYSANHPELLAVEEEPTEAEEGDEIYDVNALTEEQQAMIGPMGALIYNFGDAFADEDTTHTWTAAEDSWGPFNDLFNDFAYLYDDGSERIRQESDDLVIVSEDFLEECASALYADFDGTLPEIPAIVEEGMGIRQKDNDSYSFGVADRGEDSMDFSIYSWVAHADGSDTLLVQAFDSLGDLKDTYQFDLVENSYTQEQEDPVFVYAVSDMTKISENYTEGEDGSWMEVEILDSSDEEALLEEDDTWDEEWDDTWDAAEEEYDSEDYDAWITDDEDTYDTWDYSWYTEDKKEEEKSSSSGSSNTANQESKKESETDQKKEEKDNKEEKESKAESKESKEEKTAEQKEEAKKETENVDDKKEEENTQDSGNDGSESDPEFKESWELIQSYEMSQTGYDARDLADSKYFCTSLSFTVDGSTLVDQGDYYEVKAVFNKPVLLPQNMGVGDTYTADTNALKGETTVFTGGLDLDGDFSVFSDASGIGTTYGWYGNFNGEDGMTEVIGDDGYRLEEPFYEGILRIRKDAVMGNLLDYNNSYQTVTASDLAEGNGWGGYWSNYTAFDADGYVTELIYNGC